MPEQQQEALKPLVEALSALQGLGLEEQTLIDAMVREDNTALDKVNAAIARSGNRAEIIEKMREATELMQAALEHMSKGGVDNVVAEIQEELAKVGEPLPQQVEEPIQPTTPLEPIVIHEDSTELAKVLAERQAEAVSELTRAERFSADEHGASTVGLSALDLMRVTGSDAESINAYLAEQARALGKRDVMELSDAEFETITNDTQSFHKWSAKYWLKQLITERKEVARGIAQHITEPKHNQGGRYSRATYRDPVSEHVIAKPYRIKREQQNQMNTELADFERSGNKSITEAQQQLADQHAALIQSFEQSLLGQGMTTAQIEAAILQQRALLESVRATVVSERQTALQAEISARKELLDYHKAELDELEKQTRHTVAVGIKREMVLSVDRWGKAIQKVATEYPDLVQRDEQTGKITLDIDAVRQQPAALKLLVSQIGKEINRAGLADNQLDKQKMLRAKNLEAIITGPEEAELAVLYLDELVKAAGSKGVAPLTLAGEKVYRSDALTIHEGVWNLLCEKKFATVPHELKALPMYKSAGKELPSALPSAVARYKAALQEDKDSVRYSDYPNQIADSVVRLLDARVTQAKGNELLSTSFLSGLSDLATIIGEQGIITNRASRRAAGAMLQTFERWRGGGIEVLKRNIYDAATKNSHVLWSDREQYVRTAVVVGDFIGRNEKAIHNWSQDSASQAAIGQIELHARSLAKTNRAEALAWLDGVAADVQKSFEEHMEYSNRTYPQSVDPTQAVLNWRTRIDGMRAVVDAMELRMAKIAKLKSEL